MSAVRHTLSRAFSQLTKKSCRLQARLKEVLLRRKKIETEGCSTHHFAPYTRLLFPSRQPFFKRFEGNMLSRL